MADKTLPASQRQLRAEGAQLYWLFGPRREKLGHCVWKARLVAMRCNGPTEDGSSNSRSQAPLLGACRFTGPPRLGRNHLCAKSC